MITFNNAKKICSPLDVVVLEIETQQIVNKEEIQNYDFVSSLSDVAEKYIVLGEYPTRNPTYWKISEGKEKKEISDWKERIKLVLSNDSTFRVHWSDLDNNSQVATARASVAMIMHNCSDIPEQLIKEVKCATAYTAFGKIDLDLS